MNVIVNDLVTQYSLTGAGKLVVLLHGWGDNSRGLAGLNTQLSEHYRVVTLDLPGFGGTQLPPGIWGLDDYASFIRDFMAKLGLTQPYAIVGHSNGGAIAIRGCARHLLKPTKLILVAASGIRNNRSPRRRLLAVVAKVGKVATFWLPGRYRQALRARLYGAAGSDLLVVEALQATFKKIVHEDVQADAEQLALPTLLIYAENDQAVPLKFGQCYHSLIKKSRLEIIKDAGHFVHLDQPTQVQQLIEKFLAL
jgi:pimeloyl-ACP methyl ester carboxylesterase